MYPDHNLGLQKLAFQFPLHEHGFGSNLKPTKEDQPIIGEA